MKILVTGATGFIGQHLVKRLSKDKHQIWCIVRSNSDKNKVDKLQKLGVKTLVGDLTNIKEINLPKKIDWVFHLAALVDTGNNFSFKKLYRQNVKTTQDLAKFYLGKTNKFIFLSSMAAIGIRNEPELITEKTVCLPTSNYGRSKLEAEKCLLKLYQEKKFPVVILRPPTVYGPGERYNFLKLGQAIFQKKFRLIGSGKNRMSFCYVDNLVEAVILAAKSQKGAGEVFLIDDSISCTLKKIALEIAKAEEKTIPSLSIPYPLAYLAGVGFEFLTKILPVEPPLTRGRVMTLTANFAYDISKIKKTLKYQPKVSFSKAVVQTIKSFEKEGLCSNRLEEEICSAASKEGIGSIYERIMVKRFFEDLSKQYVFDSVLEYKGIEITKGIDNITFLRLDKKVTSVNGNTDKIQRGAKFDLVWNFAVLQLQPGVIEEMIALSNQLILIFVPNFLNWGMPVHEFYHFITRTDCQHAERGSLSLRTLWGIKKLAKQKGIEIVKIGYIDMPFLPDIGFSIRELKETLGFEAKSKERPTLKNSRELLPKLERLGLIEKLPLPQILQLPFAHHIYLLGKVK